MRIDPGDPALQMRRCGTGHGEPEVQRPIRCGGQRCGDLHCLVIRRSVPLPLACPVEHQPTHGTDSVVDVLAQQHAPASTSDGEGLAGGEDCGQRRRPGVVETSGERRRPVVSVQRPAPDAVRTGVGDDTEPGLRADPRRHQHRIRGSDHGGPVVNEQSPDQQSRMQVDLRAPPDPLERLRLHGGDRGVLSVPGEARPLDPGYGTAGRLRGARQGTLSARCRSEQREAEQYPDRSRYAGSSPA
jgi:hypothetical protein